jgi:hypothetical protein
MPVVEDAVKVERRQWVISKIVREGWVFYTGVGTWTDKIKDARIFYEWSAANDLASTLTGASVMPKDEVDVNSTDDPA